MRGLFLFCLMHCVLCHGQDVTLPYNPDFNQDSAIGAPDLLQFLPLFGGYFSAQPVLIDGQTLESYIDELEAALDAANSDTVTLPFISGTQPGDMLLWNGEAWTILPPGTLGDFLYFGNSGPEWKNLIEVLDVEGCTDPAACNYNAIASTDNGSCTYQLIPVTSLGSGQTVGPVSFDADVDSLTTLDFVMEFAGNGSTFATDLAMLISDPEGRCISVGGFDLSFTACPDTSIQPIFLDWPFSSGSEGGTFNGTLDFNGAMLGGTGSWTISIMNGWSSGAGNWSMEVLGIDGFQCN